MLFSQKLNSSYLSLISILRNEHGVICENDKDTSETLNAAFQSVSVKEEVDWDQSAVTNNNYEGDIAEDKVTKEEVREAIKALKNGKAFGPDGIPNEIIMMCEEELLEPICIVFNKSLNEGSIPEMWRCGNVVPILKKGNKEDPLNYRPVSLTCVLCKIFESIIYRKGS